MIAAAICQENVRPAGFVLDTGPVRLTQRSHPRTLPKWKRLLILLRLTARFPREYAPLFLHKLGIHPPEFYPWLRRKEDRLHREILRLCHAGVDPALAPDILRFPTFREAAQETGAPFHEVNNINSEQAGAVLRSMQPDVIVSLGDRILKPHTLEIPRLGVLNCHSSLLPGLSGEFRRVLADRAWRKGDGRDHSLDGSAGG